MSYLFVALNVILAAAFMGVLITFASIIIPLALACVVAVVLALWLYSNTVDVAFYWIVRAKRWYSSRT